MNRAELTALAVSMALCVGLTACSGGKSNPAAEAPPPLKVEKVEDRNLFQVDKPERFQLTQAVEHLASPELKVTGTVTPDISRAVPVISLATGRVVEIERAPGRHGQERASSAQGAERRYFGRFLGLPKGKS